MPCTGAGKSSALTEKVVPATFGGTALRDIPLDRFFHPKVVAFVGASATRRSPQRLLFRTIQRKIAPEGGVVHPVNPRHAEIDGERCYPSIHEVPGDIDLAVIASGDVVSILEDVVRRRPAFVMVYAAGFAESGPEGRQQEERILRILDGTGVHLLGPNTTLNSFLPLRTDLPGSPIALVSHSGNHGRHLWQGQEVGIPLSHWAPTGNEVDLEVADFVKYFAEQPDVGAVAGYIEGFRDGRTMMLAADYAMRRGTPIVLSVLGRSSEGAERAMSHTAHLAAADAVTSAVLRQYGVSRVDTIDELLYASAMLAQSPPPKAGGIALYGISGGTLGHLTDFAVANGLSVPELERRTVERLRASLPPHIAVSNPVDGGGRVGPEVLEALLEDRNIGVVCLPFAANAYELGDSMVRDLVAVAATAGKPVCVLWGSPNGDEPVYREVLVGSGVLTFRTFHQFVAAMRAYFGFHEYRARYRSPFPVPAAAPPGAALEVLGDRTGALSELDVKRLLAAYGIPVSRDVAAGSVSDAVAAAEAIGYPVVMKVLSPDISHKSDLGLVRLGLASPGAVEEAYHELVDRAAAVAPSARMEGVLVCEQVATGVETVLGLSRDPVFGPTVMFGLGGIFVETLGDVAFGVPPFGEDHARRMVDELRGAPLLRGSRGRPPVDRTAVVAAIMALQRLALDLGGRIAEIDVNPLVAGPDGVVALDALASLR